MASRKTCLVTLVVGLLLVDTLDAQEPGLGARSGHAVYFVQSVRTTTTDYFMGNSGNQGFTPNEALTLKRVRVTGDVTTTANPGDNLVVDVYKNSTATKAFSVTHTLAFTGTFATESSTVIDSATISISDDFFAKIYLSGGVGAVADISVVIEWEYDTLTGEYNVRHLGATGDGTTDDASAIQGAIDAAEAAGGGTVYFPPGTYVLGTRLSVESSNVHLLGAGRNAAVLKRKSGATLSSVLHLGKTDASDTRIENCSVRSLRLDGNSSCTDAVLKCWNNLFCVVDDVQVVNGSNHGLATDGDAGDDDPRNQANEFHNVEARANSADGMHFKGEKNGRFSDLYSNSNAANGVVWEAFTGPTVAESTQNVVSNVVASSNGSSASTHAGIVLDGVAKLTASTLNSNNNTGFGLLFKSTHAIMGNTLAGANSGVFSSIVLRNNSGGGIGTGANAFVIGAEFQGVEVLDSGGATSILGMNLKGWQRCHFSNLRIESVAGTAIKLQVGSDPNGGTQQCANLAFTNVLLLGNGHVSASENHGVSIVDGSRDISIAALNSAGSQTSGSYGEVNVGSSVSNIRITGASLDAVTSGNEWKVASGAEDQVFTDSITYTGGVSAVPSVASADPLVLPVFGNIVSVSGTTNFDTITASVAGRVVTLKFDSSLTVSGTDNINLQGTSTFPATSNDTLTLYCTGSGWLEISRSAN